MPRESLFDQFYKGLTNAIADIREKFVEEVFFGRANDRDWPQAHQPESDPGISISITQWPQARDAQSIGVNPEPDRDLDDKDIDR